MTLEVLKEQAAEELRSANEVWLFEQDLRGEPAPQFSPEVKDVRAEYERRRANNLRMFAEALRGGPPFSPEPLTDAVEDEAPQVLPAISPVNEGSWDPAKHPRGGFPQNHGWWSPAGVSVGADSSGAALGGSVGTRSDGIRSRSPFMTVSDSPPPQQASSNGAAAHAHPAAGQSSRNSSGSPPDPERLRKDDALTYFKLLFGDKGQKLLKAFEASGGTIKVDEAVLWGNSALDTRSIGRPQQIRLKPDLNPVEAANELMDRLIDASGLTEVRQHLDHYGFANVEALIDSYKQSVKQAAGTVALAAELYLSGISIASEGADWVVTLSDLSEGNYYAAIGLLPLLPASIGKTGVVLKHGRQSLRIRVENLRAIKALPINELIELLESTRKLARNMEKAGVTRPANMAAHHIVPVTLKKIESAVEARRILNRFGIDIENAANGVYLPSKFDDAVNAAYHGSLHTKRYFDELKRRLKQAKSREEALLVLNQVRKELLAGTFPN